MPMLEDESDARVVVTDTRDGVVYTLTVDAYGVQLAPIELRITTAAAGGLSAATIRATPLASLLSVAAQAVTFKAALDARLGAVREALGDIPARFTCDDDYRALARAFALLRAEGDPAPIRTLAEATSESRNTVNARLQKARKRGYLTKEGAYVA